MPFAKKPNHTQKGMEIPALILKGIAKRPEHSDRNPTPVYKYSEASREEGHVIIDMHLRRLAGGMTECVGCVFFVPY